MISRDVMATTPTRGAATAEEVSYPRFSAFYNWMTDLRRVRRYQDPWRRDVIRRAHGLVLEVGAGGGQNFGFYDGARVSRVVAIEPDAAMLAFARRRLASAPVPIDLMRASVESLPFPDEHFDTVVATIVLCSVRDPGRALREIRRVLKPDGTFALLEHVRAPGKLARWLQDVLVPVTTRLSGNCHWNRDTRCAVASVGFRIIETMNVRGGLQPVVIFEATPHEATPDA